MPTYFPDLPKLPDPSAPFKKAAEGMQTLATQMQEAENAREQMDVAAGHARELLDKLMTPPPPFRRK